MAGITSREQFDKQAAHYNQQWNQWSEASLEWLLSHARCTPADRLLDVATGTGFTALAFASRVAEVVGVDVSEGMLDQARKNSHNAGNVRFEMSAAEALPFGDGGFDIVTCRVAPHHFESVARFCAESFRVLRSGGRFLIADTTVPDDAPDADAWQNRVEWLRDRSHVRNYSPPEWRKFVENAGFVLEAMEDCAEQHPITLRDWLRKSGCAGEAAREVEKMFATAPESVKRTFDIRSLADADTSFNWLRVVLAARKP